MCPDSNHATIAMKDQKKTVLLYDNCMFEYMRIKLQRHTALPGKINTTTSGAD